jgi:hypothetical protein
MTWLELYNFLNEQANKSSNIGKFDWTEKVKVFDFETLDYFNCDLIQLPDQEVTFSIDTYKDLETISGTRN